MRGAPSSEGKAEITDAFSVLASYAYTDSEITKANPNATGISNEGNRFALSHASRHRFGWTTHCRHRPPISELWRWRPLHRSDFWRNANKFDIPSYTVFDAAVRYDFGKADPKLEGFEGVAECQQHIRPQVCLGPALLQRDAIGARVATSTPLSSIAGRIVSDARYPRRDYRLTRRQFTAGLASVFLPAVATASTETHRLAVLDWAGQKAFALDYKPFAAVEACT